MEDIKIFNYDHSTGESILRDPTNEEIIEIEKTSSNLKKLKLAESATKAKKDQLLDRLGISAEEAELLLQ
jgi:hypothetical protein